VERRLMANFPTSLDDGTSLPDPTATSKRNNPSHAGLHSSENAAIKAVEAKLGTGASAPTNNTFLRGTGIGSSAWGTLTSAQLAAGVTDETGSGALVFANTPTLVTPKADTINEATAANGVTIDGLNLKDGKLNTADSVVTASYTDGSIKPEHLLAGTGATWTWATWSPTWTNFTVGNATTSYRYLQVGKTVLFSVEVTFGNSTAMGSVPTFTLPVASANYYATGVTSLGAAAILDNGSAFLKGDVVWLSTTTAKLSALNAGSTYLATNDCSSTVPMTWTTLDRFSMLGSYEAA
jgi:hypothetical protein